MVVHRHRRQPDRRQRHTAAPVVVPADASRGERQRRSVARVCAEMAQVMQPHQRSRSTTRSTRPTPPTRAASRLAGRQVRRERREPVQREGDRHRDVDDAKQSAAHVAERCRPRAARAGRRRTIENNGRPAPSRQRLSRRRRRTSATSSSTRGDCRGRGLVTAVAQRSKKSLTPPDTASRWKQKISVVVAAPRRSRRTTRRARLSIAG